MEERYRSLNLYFRERFLEKVYKLSLNGHMTCPNRDGTLGTRGCIFCSEGGSGEFSEETVLTPGNYLNFTAKERTNLIRQQLRNAKLRLSKKNCGKKFVAYFQAYTNTYAPVPYLRTLFSEVLSAPDIVGLSVGTRPDCLPDEVISLLSELNRKKPVFVELGLQTIHDKTAQLIRRGYALPVFETAVNQLRKQNLEVIVHVILGLPGETKQDMLETIHYLNGQDIQGIKLQLLHVLEGTDLAALFRSKNSFPILTLAEYCDLLCEILGNLRPDLVIHRLTGDGPKKLLIAPMFSADKKNVLNTMNKEIALRNITQGCYL